MTMETAWFKSSLCVKVKTLSSQGVRSALKGSPGEV